jgi:hypothetical protein
LPKFPSKSAGGFSASSITKESEDQTSMSSLQAMFL